jgi:prepilin-type N-terminal cleavage/methylation domain-containing protein
MVSENPYGGRADATPIAQRSNGWGALIAAGESPGAADHGHQSVVDRNTKLRTGFSLVELICVIVAIALIGGIAAAHYGAAVTHYEADAAARRITADLRLAQANARATSLTQTVTFTSASLSYQLSNLASLDNSSASTYTVKLANGPYNLNSLTASFNGAAQVSFDQYGLPNAGGTIVIQAGTFQRTITVEATTGQTAIQ